MSVEFVAYPKVPRLFRDMVITEKLDGTNACVVVADDGQVSAQSRRRAITPEKDNYGFARWAAEHADELRALGPGHHFGEWWGQGVQRGYGLDEKRFSLFNPDRYAERPACCHVVPVLARATFSLAAVDAAVEALRLQGSHAAPGYMDPEGIVVFHTAARQVFKVTLDNDEVPKALAA